jgi:transposase-like protein
MCRRVCCVRITSARLRLTFNSWDVYRDIEEVLAERGVEVDHVTVYLWVQRFTPLLADAARFARQSPGDRWFVDETYVKVAACGATSPGRRPARAGHRRARLEAS